MRWVAVVFAMARAWLVRAAAMVEIDVTLPPVITRAADRTTVYSDQGQGGAHPAALAFPGYPPGFSPVPGLALASPGASGPGRRPLLAVGAVAVLGGRRLGAAAARRRRLSGARTG